MDESLEQLADSELVRRLRRRITEPAGVIDTRRLMPGVERIIEWLARSNRLASEIRDRYVSRNVATEGYNPLILEQPGLANFFAYLTNNQTISSTTNNSYAATTNQYISSAGPTPLPQTLPPPASETITHTAQTSSSIPLIGTELPARLTDTPPLAGTFRIVRKTGARVTDTLPADRALTYRTDARQAERADPKPAERVESPAPANTTEAARARLSSSAHSLGDKKGTITAKTETTLAARTVVPRVAAQVGPTKLVLALTQLSQDLNAGRPFAGSKTNPRPVVLHANRPTAAGETEPRQEMVQGIQPPTAGKTEPTLELVQANRQPTAGTTDSRLELVQTQRRPGNAGEAQAGQTAQASQPASGPATERSVADRIPETRIGFEPGPIAVDADGQVASLVPTLPVVRNASAPPRLQTWPSDFVWRKNADPLTVSGLLADTSSSGPLAAVRRALDSLPAAQSLPRHPGGTVETPVRSNEQRIGSEVTAEQVIRRISRALVIERERRGY